MTKRKATNIEVKKNNRNQIFRYLCKNNNISNPDIAYALKISVPTVTQNTKELMERGLVKEVGELQSTGGRRAKGLSVVKNAKLALGLDITKNHIGLLITNLVGEILNYERSNIPFQNKETYYSEVRSRINCFLEESGIDRTCLLGMGISFPGIVNLEEGRITYSHVLGVKDLSLEKISRNFDYPCFFINDANAGAFAEGLKLDETARFFYLSLSNSVGGAIYSEKKLIQGKEFRCGEVGHMTLVPDGHTCYCGKKGCMDAYCSAKVLGNYTDGKLEQFFEKLNQGDLKAEKLWEMYTTHLAIAINNIHMVLDCDVILGGYVGSFTRPYISEIWNKVNTRNTFEEPIPYIRAGVYKMETSALGAALKVIEEFIEDV